jgi:hypothetical protein
MKTTKIILSTLVAAAFAVPALAQVPAGYPAGYQQIVDAA